MVHATNLELIRNCVTFKLFKFDVWFFYSISFQMTKQKLLCLVGVEFVWYFDFFLGSLCDFCLKMYKNQENYHFQKLSCYDDNATLTIFVLNIFPSHPCSLKLKLLNKNDIKSIGLMNILILQWSSLNCLPVFRTVNIKNIHVWYIYFCRTFHIFYCRFSII